MSKKPGSGKRAVAEVSATCGNCAFGWKVEGRPEDRRCHRYPPSGGQSAWPWVNEHDLCGEYKRPVPV